MAEKTKTKKQFREEFEGSCALFEACWRRLKDVHTSNDRETADWLEAFAAEMVNNPRSKFYIYG